MSIDIKLLDGVGCFISQELINLTNVRRTSHAGSSYQIHPLFSAYFQRIASQIVETVVVLSVCHLFGLYNPNQVSDALELPKGRLYRDLGHLSLYHAKCLNLRLGCAIAVKFIRDAENKSASTQSRRCITVSVDDTNLPRDGNRLAYCSRWWSKEHNTAIKCQNVLGTTLKVGTSM